MLQHQDHFHGSDLEKIEKIYGIRKEEIISFSANVNPLGISPLLRRTLTEHIDAITAYPDREYTSLRQCIAGYCGCEAEHGDCTQSGGVRKQLFSRMAFSVSLFRSGRNAAMGRVKDCLLYTSSRLPRRGR